jgi:hypothetical protein
MKAKENIYLEGFVPGRFKSSHSWFMANGLDFTLEQDQHGVHDSHNEWWRSTQFTHGGYK